MKQNFLIESEVVRMRELMGINEDYRKSLAAAALACSLIGGVVRCETPKDVKTEYSIDGLNFKDTIRNISALSKEPSKDTTLNKILSNIKSNINSDDPETLARLTDQLISHMENKYDVKIENRDISSLSESDIKGMGLFELFGWLGSLMLAVCGVPQAIQSYKDKHSEGISWGFLLLWGFGEIFAMLYVGEKMDLPLLMNYMTNILIVGVMLYYKIHPKKKDSLGMKDL